MRCLVLVDLMFAATSGRLACRFADGLSGAFWEDNRPQVVIALAPLGEYRAAISNLNDLVRVSCNAVES